jgi:hypothetical protein
MVESVLSTIRFGAAKRCDKRRLPDRSSLGIAE